MKKLTRPIAVLSVVLNIFLWRQVSDLTDIVDLDTEIINGKDALIVKHIATISEQHKEIDSLNELLGTARQDLLDANDGQPCYGGFGGSVF